MSDIPQPDRRGTLRIIAICMAIAAVLVILGCLVIGGMMFWTIRQYDDVFEAIDSGDALAVRCFVFLARGADGPRDGDDWTPLMYAAYLEDPDMVKLLIDASANVNLQSTQGGTPLEFAGRERCQAVYNLLLDHGADVTLVAAACQGDAAAVKAFLAEGVDVNSKAPFGGTALHMAAVCNRKAVAEVLIEHGADLNFKDAYGDAPLHEAVNCGNAEIVELLASRGADLEIEDSEGDTPLTCAADDKIAAILRKHGAKE